MEDIILSLEPTFQRLERFLLWHNRYASLVAFTIGHGIFYAIARTGLRPFCAMTIIVLIFHILDCIKKKRLYNEEKDFSELTKFVLHSYRNLCQTQEKLQTIKTENRMKYSMIIIMICLLFAYIGIKINGFYVSYLFMLILFTLPAIVYHKLLPKLLKRLAPILEQLDESMEYKRRTLIDRKDLLVKIKTPGLNEIDDDEDIQKLKQQQDRSFIINDDDEEKLILKNTKKQPNINDLNFDMLSDSSSSIGDDETAHLNELYANVGDKIDGKHRIKIKGDEIKIKGRSKIIDKNFFQTNNLNKNSVGEPDLTSFDFLNEYDE